MKYIEIKLPRKQGKGNTLATVDDADYDALVNACKNWRMSLAGYVVATINKRLVRMSYFLTGKHIQYLDGNPLNHQRSNLLEINCRRPMTDMIPTFGIHQPREDVEVFGKNCHVHSIPFDDRKVYHGTTLEGRPHGVGVLVLDELEQVVGLWKQGNLESGFVMRMREGCDSDSFVALRVPMELKSFELVRNGYRLP